MADEPFDRAEFVTYFRDEADELLARIDADVLHLEGAHGSGAVNAEIVNSLFRALHTIKGNAAMLGFADVANLAHGLESLCDQLRSGKMQLSAPCIDLLLGGRDLLAALVAAAPAGAAPPPGYDAFLVRLGAVAAGHPEHVPAAEPEPPSPAGASPAATTSRRPTIRVDIERLDHLLNLVGELVVSRTRISDIAAGLQNKELLETIASLARTSGEIQESLMKVRMVPVGRVFERFPRLVRDIAKARGKDVQLRVDGAQTELDKTIVDQIGEPLMHLLRNCVDHGIEPPAQREAAGKPRAGTIRLNAYHAGNQIVIEMSDDGAGIDTDRVLAQATVQGLVARGAALTQQEIVELIFAPGFSTAEIVSELSGRGVGMDVVQKTVGRLKGSFSVTTEAGKGTRFEMKLPLTLAIIAALLVKVGNELYAIPLDSVIESQRIEVGDIRTIQGCEVITLRGSIVPLVRLTEFFGLRIPRDRDKAMVVIVNVGVRQIGLVVDAFGGEQEIVIKPLSDVIGRVPGISGATILGSGAIALILDVHALVADAYQSGRIARVELAASER
jgi:two-component system chemotaxis sensor kinase CheA